MDPRDLTLRCTCGHLTLVAADLTPANSNRIACHCEGCRQFAQRIDPALLDAHGGTERLQVCPASLTITSGADALACLQQSDRGAYRWYASCCRATLGVTLTSDRVPFVGLDVRRIDTERLGVPLELVIGPVRARVNLELPRREAAAMKADLRALLAMLRHLVPLTWRWWRRGDQHRSPFFDPKTHRPVAPVERLHGGNEAPRLRATGCR